MLLDKAAVIDLLDDKAADYDGNILAIKLLPDDTIFDIVVEDIVTAEYYDKDKEEYFRFELSYDYFSTGREIPESHVRNLDVSIKINLSEQEVEASGNSTKVSSTFKWTMTLLSLSLIIFIFIYIYMFYSM